MMIKGISSEDEEVVLHNKDVAVNKRESKISSAIINNNTYERYITTFVYKSTTKYIYLSYYDITQVYAKVCGVYIFK